MKGIVFLGETQLELREFPEPKPGPSEVLVEMKASGLDYLAMKLTGKVRTTASGLSEAVLWDFKAGWVTEKILGFYGIPDFFLRRWWKPFPFRGKAFTQNSINSIER
jgi:hypothetical protein